MRKIRIGITCLLASLGAVFFAGCGQEVVTVPSVVSTVPAQGATNVAINTAISATFNMAMAPATLTGSTFTVAGPSGAVAGTVTYSGVTATFTPGASLAYGASYTATITTGAANAGGTPLIANYVWTFTTIAPAVPPTVTATVPVNAATNVSISQALTATFSEAMNSATISSSTFTLTGPAGAVSGTVTYSGLVATFTPTASLANNTLYTATITTGATSVAGAPLSANYVWTFTTILPPPVVVSTVPVNAATGVPVSQVLTATFNEAINCATLTSTTFTVAGPGVTPVTGTVSCAGAVATFTPESALAVNTLYTATITTGATSVAGTPLAGSYAWSFRTVPAPTPPTVISTVPANQANGVPINQALAATFSVAMNPATIGTSTFTLSGPGGVAVTGAVTYVAGGSVATFTPDTSLALSTTYTATITTGATDLAGTALASNYVWTFTTAATVNGVPPTVISVIPLNAATDVPLNQIVSATFSTAMDPATISSATFTLTGPGTTAVSGLVAYAAIGNTLTFTPATNLAPNTTFTATITTGAKNLAGTALTSNYVWTFTTGAAIAVVSPELVSTVPLNAATGVALNQAVSAAFTEAMDPLTLTTATFLLYQGTSASGTPIPATITYDAINFIATLTPTNSLTASTSYTATVTNGATDLAGNPLGSTGAQNPWTFTTGAAIVSPPVVLGPNVALFGSFGGNAGITNQGINTVVNGNIGTTAASSLITGFHDTSVLVGGVYECTYTETTLNQGQVNGLIDTAAGSSQPTVACPNEGTAVTFNIATLAESEGITAYTTLANLPGGIDVSTLGGGAGELGNRTLAPGIYKSAPGSYSILTGDLTLDAQGDPNAYWVFQMATSLTVGDPTGPQTRSVILANGAKASNVFWAVGGLPGAVINYGGGGTMVGTIISQPGITVSSPGQSTSATVTTINGRVIALYASVTIVNTVINVP